MTADPIITSTLHVLLIEDDESDVFLVQEILKNSAERSGGPPFNLIVASTLEDGLARLSENSVDVVLLDLMLPDSRGMDSLKKVVARAKSVPVVVLSNMNDESISVEAVKLGAQDFLVKGHVEAMWLARIMRYAVARKTAISSLQKKLSTGIPAAALDVCEDPIFILTADGTIRHCNAAARKWADADLAGHSFPDWMGADRGGEAAQLRVLPFRDGRNLGLVVAIKSSK